MFYLQDLSGSYDVMSAINRGSACPLCCVSCQPFQYLHSTRMCYCSVTISSPSMISLKCCEKALKDDRHIASVAKLLLTTRGSPQVRGLQASACLFQWFTLLIDCSIVQLLRPPRKTAGVLIVSRLVLAVNPSVQGCLNFSSSIHKCEFLENWLSPVIWGFMVLGTVNLFFIIF